jgi:hypothetical protein
MPGDGRNPPKTFDLRSADRSSTARRPIYRAAPILIGFGLLAIAVTKDLSVRWSNQLDLKGTFVVLVLCVALTYLGVYKFAAAAERMVIDQTGVSFVYPSGATVVRRWSDPGFRVRLYDVRFTRTNLKRPGRQYYDLLCAGGLTRPDSPITVEAFEALAAAALSKGLEIIPPDWAQPAPGEQYVTIRTRKHAT